MSHIEDYNRKQVEQAEQASRIYNETIHALQNEERFVIFFKQYNPQSVEQFIKHYAQQKAYWFQNADNFYQWRNRETDRWRDGAVGALKEIFLKKLFNLKCRWVAGEMDIKGIETSSDFDKFQYDPAGCTLVEPITRQEMDCYLAFIDDKEWERYDSETADYDEPEIFTALGYYHKQRSSSTEEVIDKEMLPRWFRYYDRHFGTGDLLKLPTTRVDLEEDYKDIWLEQVYFKTFTKEQLEGQSPHLDRKARLELRSNPEKRQAHYDEQNRRYQERKKTMPQYKHISTYDHEMMKELVALIEPPEIQKLYRAQREWRDRSQSQERIDTSLIEMKDVKEWIPVNAHEDYRDAIEEAYDAWSEKMHREMLPVVFDEYLEAVAAKKPFDWKDRAYDSGPSGYDNSEIKRRLLAARKWKGEPENFDFLKKENLPKAE